MQAKEDVTDEMLPQLVEILKSDDRAEEVLKAARMSMGMSINAEDLENVNDFAGMVILMSERKKDMRNYVGATMGKVAPNLRAVVGDQVSTSPLWMNVHAVA